MESESLAYRTSFWIRRVLPEQNLVVKARCSSAVGLALEPNLVRFVQFEFFDDLGLLFAPNPVEIGLGFIDFVR